jgi:sortase A
MSESAELRALGPEPAGSVLTEIAPETTEPPTPAPQAEPASTPSPKFLSGPEIISILGWSLTLFGIVLLALGVYLFGLSGISHERSQTRLFRHFQNPLAFGTAPLGGPIRRGTSVAVLAIPRLGLREVVVEGTDSGQLKRGPGHLPTSPLPGQAGNAVLAARRTTYGGPFRHLGRLRRGDEIDVTTAQGVQKYRVERKLTIGAGHADVIADTADNRLTLMTSDPPALAFPPSLNPATHRLVVMAALTSPVRPAPRGRPRQRNIIDQGLTGGGVSPTLFFWVFLLLVSSIATVLLYRRTSRWTTYLITTPILLALAFLVFDNIGRWLPATL